MFSGSPALVEILGQTGYDFVMIDTEHSPVNARVLEDLIRTAELAGLIPYVRVTSLLSEVEIRLALEAGAWEGEKVFRLGLKRLALAGRSCPFLGLIIS